VPIICRSLSDLELPTVSGRSSGTKKDGFITWVKATRVYSGLLSGNTNVEAELSSVSASSLSSLSSSLSSSGHGGRFGLSSALKLKDSNRSFSI
jgi:hypothetical protein